MPDPRIQQYAALLVDQCLDIQPRQQVLIVSSPLARPLLEEVSRRVAAKGAYTLPRLSFGGPGADWIWAAEAPEELLREPAPAEVRTWMDVDALIAIQAPENTREAAGLSPERLALLQAGSAPFLERVVSGSLPWVGCQYPTPALAQDAEMSFAQFEDFLYGACLLDWDAERERMQRYADRFDAAGEVRIVGVGTDLTLSLAGRSAKVDARGANIPGGEFFFSPVEDSAEGVIHFAEFPAVYLGRELPGIRFRFERGRIVEASADRNEDFLLKTLDSDEGARRLGELGVGCNPGITRYLRNTLFDEKIDGTVHIAVGRGFPELGGSNVSAVHWDIVKDLRKGGQLFLDGELVQENGTWQF
ncbi:MAG: aminopeptidase [Actinomycetota bacterium]|nr:aminopeptidase [Actinomycetota bacterium]